MRPLDNEHGGTPSPEEASGIVRVAAPRLSSPSGSDEKTRASIGAATRGSALALAGTGIGAMANFAMLIIVSRRFDETIFGVFAAVTSVFILGGVILRLGAGVGATYWVSRARALHRPDMINPLIRIALVPAAVASTVVALATILAAALLARWLTNPEGGNEAAVMFRVAAIALPFWVIGQVLLGVTRGLGTMRPTVLFAQIGRQVGQLVTVGMVVLFDGGAAALMAAWAFPYLFVLLGPAAWLLRRPIAPTSPADPSAHESQDFDRPAAAFWRYTFPQSINSVAQGGIEKFDIIALGVIATTGEQGTYLVVNRIAHVVALAMFSFGMALAPQLAAAFAQQADERANELVSTVTAWMLLLVGPVLWTILLFPEPILGIFGGAVANGDSGLRIISGGLLVIIMMGPTENLLLMSGGSTAALIDNTLGLVVNVTMNIWLIPKMGIEGAAIAWVCSVGLVRILALVQVWRRRRVTAMGRSVFTAAAVVGAGFGGIGAMTMVLVGSGWLGLFVAVTAGSIATFTMTLMGRDVLQLDQLKSSLRRPSERRSHD